MYIKKSKSHNAEKGDFVSLPLKNFLTSQCSNCTHQRNIISYLKLIISEQISQQPLKNQGGIQAPVGFLLLS